MSEFAEGFRSVIQGAYFPLSVFTNWESTRQQEP